MKLSIPQPQSAANDYFKLGTTRNPAGHEINGNRRSLRFAGQPVFPGRELLPLRPDAPLYREPKDRPDFGKADSLAAVQSVPIVTLLRD